MGRSSDSVRRVVEQQVVELTPAPHGLQITTVRQTAERWLTRWHDIVRDPVAYLPNWACRHITQLYERVCSLPSRLDGDSLCHFDLRDDNLLIRTDRTAVIVDWGMARIGPAWVDPVLLELQDSRCTLDAMVSLQAKYGVPPDTVIDFLLAFGGSQAWSALRRPHEGLPTLAAFCREDSQRLLERARRRLDELPLQAGWTGAAIR